MPKMKLDVVDAAELAELLQFLSQWLARDPARLGDSLAQFAATPPTAWPSCAATWSGSSSCSAAATASSSSTPDHMHQPLRYDRCRLAAQPPGRHRR